MITGLVEIFEVVSFDVERGGSVSLQVRVCEWL